MKKVIFAPAFEHFVDRWHLSPALDTGEFVFFSGITGCRPNHTVASDPEQQFREAFQFLGDTLTAAGLSFEDIVEMTTYHIDLREHLSAFVRVKDEYIRAPYPAWSAIGVVTTGASFTAATMKVMVLAL